MVENTPTFNPNPQDQQRLDYSQELIGKSQDWDELIANKKSVMKIILDQQNEDTRAEIVLNSSYEDAGELIEFLKQVRRICNDTKGKNILFNSQLTNITEHHFQPKTIVKQILVTHLMDDTI